MANSTMSWDAVLIGYGIIETYMANITLQVVSYFHTTKTKILIKVYRSIGFICYQI